LLRVLYLSLDPYMRGRMNDSKSYAKPVYGEQVIEKMAAAAQALGWPEQIVDVTRAQLQSIAKMQIQTMDYIMDVTFRGTGRSTRGNMRRCDYCGGRLGMIVHRNWMLRFCSKLCKKAYEHKAEEQRLAKQRHLAFLANVTHSPDTSTA
jgi:hypothetical protein